MFGNDLIGSLFSLVTTNVTGHNSLTALLILAVLVLLLTAVFKVPLEFSALLMFPLAIVFIIYLQSMAVVFGVIILVIVIMLARKFITN